ncbi:MAG: MFS transporter, partial [Firmicutes bacterium]|nr:MFS transporter [Bacillota bacterium]
MFSLLLALIYLAFFGMGLPDSILGSAWPLMQNDLGIPLGYASLLTVVISVSTIVSTLCTSALLKKLGTGLLCAISTACATLALLGFAFSNSFWLLFLFAFPYGFGAGAIDATLNGYVATHLDSKHMNWLHCVLGLGAATGPLLMSFAITNSFGWHGGYLIVGILQASLTFLLFLALPLWHKPSKTQDAKPPEPKPTPPTLLQSLQQKGVLAMLLACFAYVALESLCGVWIASYLVLAKGVPTPTAALFGSLFYLGITLGRFLAGFFAKKTGDKTMIRIGIGVSLLAVFALLLPFSFNQPTLIGLLVLGLGFAPILPAMVHDTPHNFGETYAESI